MERKNVVDDWLIEEQAKEGTASDRSLRWLADGATTLDEVIDRLRDYAGYLAELKLRGWALTGEVDNLYMFMQNPAYPIGEIGDEGEDL